MKMKRRAIEFVLGTLLVLPLALPAHAMPEHGMDEMGMMAQLRQLHGEEFDVAFMSMMIAHHEGAIEMSEWILERTDDRELIETAEAIIAAQGPEIEQMRQWLQEWYGVAEPDPMMMRMMHDDMEMMMRRMETEYDEPEVGFLREMIEHHIGAVEMALPVFTQSVRPELRELAHTIIVDQAGEIYEFSEWLTDWQ